MVGVVRLMRIRPQVAFSGAATAASNAFHGFWLPTPLPASTFPKRLVHSVAVGENTVSYLRNSSNGAELYLVGTAHVSSKSAQEVKQVINMVKPDIVAVELCEERVRNMMAGESGPSAVQMLKEFMKFPGGLGENLVNLLVKSFYQIMRSTGLEPGKEFQVVNLKIAASYL
ncbi:hypothetical protein O6H91_03G029300 [Diphasiastrum complanatum]|uniref:Uncharacterized protein n=1 Tax=Diphasiastrum complanatum TaxID=34168 RepID=A0ACC2E517_DIPCM|nr:hypothetical protein O6H91_03G029300 [Diphasiastrum complanatum]